MRVIIQALTMTALAFVLVGAHAKDAPLKKSIGPNWTWLTDYIYLYAEWTINVESDCEIEVGTGISFRNKPRGSKWNVRKFSEFTTYGMGAIHVRAIDGNEFCTIQLNQGKVGAILVYKSEN